MKSMRVTRKIDVLGIPQYICPFPHNENSSVLEPPGCFHVEYDEEPEYKTLHDV